MVSFFKIGLFAGILIPINGIAQAQKMVPTEYEVKAAFLYNFAKFVEWPPGALKSSGENFTIGILGTDPFEKEVEDEFKGKTIQDKKLVIKQLASTREALHCQVIFISASEERRLGRILNDLSGPAVLTVSDMDRFIERGGMVGFVLEDKKVRFNINRTVAQNAGLKISSELLKLAKTIVRTLLRTPIG